MCIVGSATYSSAYDDGVLLLLAADGTPIWSKSYGSFENDAATAVAFGPDGAIFVAGAVSADPVDFGGGPLPGGHSDDLFLVELTAAGGHLCSRRYPGLALNGSSAAHAIAVTPSGAAIAGGTLKGSVELGLDLPLGSTDALDILLARLE